MGIPQCIGECQFNKLWAKAERARNKALEEAARLAESKADEWTECEPTAVIAIKDAAAAIRALKVTQDGET